MAAEARANLLLIVTGSTLRAEDADRPLAYYLKQQIEHRLAEMGHPDPPSVRVVADFRWLHDEDLHPLPTISLGGPGVNYLARSWFEEEMPVSLAVDGQYYIQMDPDLEEVRASIWGMDNTTTQLAVAVFLQHFLPRFLVHCGPGAGSDDEPTGPPDPE